MSIKIIEMPHLGESVTEASIAVWLVSEGDRIEKYDPIAEAVSDKVTTEIPSNYSGIVKEFLIDIDTDVEIGTPMVKIQTDEEGEDEAAGSSEVEIETGEEFTDHINEEIDKEAEREPMERQTTSDAKQSTSKNIQKDSDSAARYSPAVVRISQERGIDLSQVEGTGKHGRITRKDVLAFDVDSQQSAAQQPSEMKPNRSEETVPAKDESARPQKAASAASVQSNGDEVVPADGIRKAIAKKMVQSSTEIPHAWLMVEADVTNIVKLREQTKTAFKEQEGVSLSYFPFFVKAVVQALKKHPVINTSWDNGNIVYHKDINISVAVATDEHLFVPVIQQADRYSLNGLSKEVSRLAGLARQGKLTTSDMQGGTMTVNNTGSFGSVQSMGIINHPQAAILQVESINKRFVPTEDGGFKAADMVNLCLSIDHRIIDGLQAGRFLQTVKENLGRFSDESDLY
ncbi:dihydrolipoamide acetyltransferase family protein [Alkalibacterium pelagium]|uniref:Dihydrolipoamide acetyltransferase component of pyruvate dehydrogenase complex n=1 Tax=Alkalibacterium pelagium TaxID=426702 RepID=A0A1H7LXY9_9LACT|nr:dihydrolipoamide acetyltransferase family protein [Alkalibacterium pelagium]GEN50997.1 dihydrolipoamide acetyltransferase component of pyruvate dehydrogenase complex [Alkalibacterium pelagium]SEL03709.1 2-oxoisovalerate dehydrogenase E2 component (dihydrolipoyl transacylase) [Alkalibacterium pelagium]